jgi:hypothetical protein
MSEAEELNAELDEGQRSAEKVADHMKRMRAASTEWLVPAEHGFYRVFVELVTVDGYSGEEETE